MSNETTAPPTPHASKTCAGPCERLLPAHSDFFGKKVDRADGLRTWCRDCTNKAERVRSTARSVRSSGLDPDRWKNAIAALADEGHETWDLPSPPVPEGFDVRGVSSQIDEAGTLEKQWIDSRPEATRFEDIQPAIPKKHYVKGVSTLLDEHGGVRAQWVKTGSSSEQDEREAWLEAVRSVCEPLPRLEPIAAPALCEDDLLAVFPVGDPHVGLLSWHEDAGENFDLNIAERNLVAAFQHLIELSPAAAQALLILIGDNTHADGQQNTTTKGTRVDVDGRTVKMARTIVRIGRRAIDLALAKFGRVSMIVERGNHDELLAAMIALALSLAYENEPRVTIDTSPEVYHWFRFGQNLIGTHHGDRAKPMDLLGVMAVDRQQDWGQTKHRRFYCGHYHHQIVKEVPGLIVEYLPTLASSDAWHRSMGYRSQRAMYMDVFHREWGHINRHVVGIHQLRSFTRYADCDRLPAANTST